MSSGTLLVSSPRLIWKPVLSAALCRGHGAVPRRIVGNVEARKRFVSLESGFLSSPEQQRRLRSGDEGQSAGAAAAAAEVRESGRRRGRCGIRAGLPVVSGVPVLGPLLNAVFNPVALFIIYAAGASRFWGGFRRTTYSDARTTKVALTALWPALFLVSATYRSNFKKAIQ